jgi:hypothetical protein
MCWRKNASTNLPVWSATIQYYVNDVVLSPIDGGAYVMSGNGVTLADSDVVARGGSDPSADVTGNWIALFPDGVGAANWSSGSIPFTLTPAAANAITVVGGALLRAAVPTGASERWEVTLTTTANKASPFVAGDAVQFTFTPTVAGTAVPVGTTAIVGLTASGLSATAVVVLPATSTGATVVANWYGTTPTSFTNPVITWTRVA